MIRNVSIKKLIQRINNYRDNPDGYGVNGISSETGIHRNTIENYYNANSEPSFSKGLSLWRAMDRLEKQLEDSKRATKRK